MREEWELDDGTKLQIETGSPYPDGFSEDDADHSWYAVDFLRFIVSILWDTYPSLRPLVIRAREACLRAWQVETREHLNMTFTPTIDVIHKPVSMIKSGLMYRTVVRYYMKNLGSRLEELLNGMFDGSFCDLGKPKTND
jgi:hypothetical protein